ncbi:heme oxygenase [Leucobacter komagatae]|uniref:Heme oxygenase n=2 Tax=Leucobacter komagatae TaxID=55969 RepID=A0A542Y792_9MICO|nr:heme oxygenase [Leucobacter komagatae]
MKDVMNFDAAVISAVTSHMNDDHVADSLLIAKAFGFPEATASMMVGLDEHAGMWRVTDAAGEHDLRVEWPTSPITERPQVRRQVVELYKAACAKLGVPAREEHQPAEGGHGAHGHGGANPHGGHGAHPHGAHGGHPHGGNPHAAEPEADGHKPFSRVIRESSWSDHSSSEGANFMEDIMRGVATKQDYIDLVAQHFFMYEALEEASQQLAADPAYADLHPAALVRLGTLEVDLEHLLGSNWRDEISPVPASEAYAARIREVAAEGWLPGIVAHHYTRYLGDLSGGQIIAKRVARQHGFDGPGIEFYNFESLGDLKAFKETYREGLDRLGETLSDDDKQRMIEEVREAYSFNTQVFVDLAKQKAAA